MRFEIQTGMNVADNAEASPIADKAIPKIMLGLGIFICLFGIAILITGFSLDTPGLKPALIGFGVVLMALAVLIPLYVLKVSWPRARFRMQKITERMTARLNASVHYVIDESGIYQTITAENQPGPVHRLYVFDGLYAVNETDRLFQIYMKKNTAFVIPKADFTLGDPADLSRFLAKELGDRFTTKNS